MTAGRLVALREALHLDDRELPVGRRLAGLQVAEPLPALGVDLLGAVQVAGDRRADLDQVLADRAPGCTSCRRSRRPRRTPARAREAWRRSRRPRARSSPTRAGRARASGGARPASWGSASGGGRSSARVSGENERARPHESAPCSPARGFPACSATGAFCAAAHHPSRTLPSSRGRRTRGRGRATKTSISTKTGHPPSRKTTAHG